jgi:hypothetical protein
MSFVHQRYKKGFDSFHIAEGKRTYTAKFSIIVLLILF